jgi:hypothetical protein
MIYDTLKSEQEIKRELAGRDPVEWLSLILEFKDPLRTRLACLVWWDFYGIKEAKNRSGNLDHFLLAPHVDCDQEKIIKAMIYCGYSESMAAHRLSSKRKK